jgi:hypothetical protein
MKRACEVLRQQVEGLPPLNNDGRPLKCHNREWRDAKARAASTPSARHVAARAMQMSTIGSPRCRVTNHTKNRKIKEEMF